MPPKKNSNDTVSLESVYEAGKQKGDMQEFLKERESRNRQELAQIGDEFNYLYPSLDDPDFNLKIASHKEFFDTKYDGEVKDVATESERICNAEFELAPHQAFVRNFLSFQTPYNSLLLYHGLGSGKTCSAISVSEEMRDYMRQMDINKRIIIVAAPNVQANFALQLFDERKLKEVDGYWNIRACVGNKFLREINPTNVQGLPRDKVISYIRRIIRKYYVFLGYIEFANYIATKSEIAPDDPDYGDAKKVAIKQARKIRREFDNRLIVIDEVQDIRVTDDNKKKRVAFELLKLVRSTENLRLLLLSATPMYNSYKEIIWLINLMNINDKRAPMELREVFDDNGDFKTDSKGHEVGRELLERKATGYVSFVRGENPYLFPFKIWPSMFSPANSIKNIQYPTIQMNKRQVLQTLQHLELFVTNIGDYQYMGYEFIIESIRRKVSEGTDGLRDMPNFENMESFGYTLLQRPLEALNIVYPSKKLDMYYSSLAGKASTADPTEELQDIAIPTIEPRDLVGKTGLARIMTYVEKDNPPFRGKFAYRTEEYGRVFAPDNIGLYSSKIKSITNAILGSEGIVLVYSQYIDGGLVPVALALEELGFTRYGSVPSLFDKPPVPPLNLKTYAPIAKGDKGAQRAQYVMITGDKALSPDNLADFLAATNTNNLDGEQVKVILLSQAGGQGLDFTNIRQVHILEPWYNMNRAEQVIGRGVRSCSHKSLPFDKHNVQLFLYGTLLPGDEEEAADLYVYRVAEAKAVQIGRVSRVLKEIAVDCLLNVEQQNFTIQNMNQIVKQQLSTGQTIDYAVGDRPFSFTCDYMSTCEYKCRPVASVSETEVKMDTYNQSFIELNNERILQRVRALFKEKHIYTKEQLIAEINAIRDYPLVQINSALNQLVTERNEFVTDKFGRIGRVVNIDRLYLFQPIELTDKNQTLYNRRVPLEFKRKAIKFPKDAIAIETRGKGQIKLGEKTGDEHQEGNQLIARMQKDYETAFASVEIEKGDEDWYKHCSLAVRRMENEGVDLGVLKDMVVSHIIDELMVNDLIKMMDSLYAKGNLTQFEKKIKSNLESRVMKAKGVEGLFWQSNGDAVLLVNNAGKWSRAESEDWRDLDTEIRKVGVDKKEYNLLVGFMADFKNEYVVFKVKQLDKARHKGARCDQAGKKSAIATLNMILGDEVYTMTNAKDIGQREICVLQELTLRLFDKERRNDKVWFLGPGKAAFNKIEQLSLTK